MPEISKPKGIIPHSPAPRPTPRPKAAPSANGHPPGNGDNCKAGVLGALSGIQLLDQGEQGAKAPQSRLFVIGGHFDGFKQNGQGYMALCPAHDDSKPSLSINEGEGGKILLHCHAGCETADILEKVGLRMADLMSGAKTLAPPRRIVATYDYRDEKGKVLFQVVRYKPKDFKQRSPDGKGGWVWTTKDVRKVLYRLPELLACKPGATVLIVEGEKDADWLAKLGLIATTNVGGAAKVTSAAGKWKPEYGEAVRGKHVVILPDNDEAGLAHAADVASKLQGFAASIKVLKLPGLAEKGDVSDWLGAGGTREKLLALVEQTPCAEVVNQAQQSGEEYLGFSGSQVPEISDIPWGVPVFIDPADDLPVFPVECLPGALRNHSQAVAENSQTPVDLSAMMDLSAVSVAVAKKAVIQPYPNNPDYTEPANTWICAPLPPGHRKTFVVQTARIPFDDFLKQFNKEHTKEFAVKKQERAALEKRKNTLTDKLSQAKPGDYEKAKGALAACLESLSKIEVYTPRFFADDVTPERLAVLMSMHGGRIAILSDEGGCFDHFAGIYNKRPNIDVYLHGHSGGTIYRDRQFSGEEIQVERAALTIGVSPQPAVIQGMNSKDRLQGRGILARFLWSFPKSTLGSRDWEPAPIPDDAKLPYSRAIRRLLDWKAKAPTVVKLSAGAYRLWIDAAKAWEKELGSGGSLSTPGIQEWAGKLPGAVARIALLLHCVIFKKWSGVVEGGTMRNALAIGEYLVPHARAAFKVLRTDPETEGARVLQNWIVKQAGKGERWFTRSQAQQNHKSRFPNVSDIDGPLRILVDRQICRPAHAERKGPGQPPTWYESNPALANTPKPET